MSSVRYSFGENNSYFYEFTLHTYNMVTTNTKIVTVMMTSTNLTNKPTELVRPYVPDLIQFLVKLCIEHSASYDAYHNNLMPFSFDESSSIADSVNEGIQTMREI